MLKIKSLDIESKFKKLDKEHKEIAKSISEIKEAEQNVYDTRSPDKSITKLESFRSTSPVKQGFESPKANVVKPFAYIDQVKRNLQDELHLFENKVDGEIDGISKSLNKSLIDLKVFIVFNNIQKIKLEKEFGERDHKFKDFSVANFEDNYNIEEVKRVIKGKIDPIKNQVKKLHEEMSEFKDPIVTELLNIRQENEGLLRELTRQQSVYREMLGEFYKMVSENEYKRRKNAILQMESTSLTKFDKPRIPIMKMIHENQSFDSQVSMNNKQAQNNTSITTIVFNQNDQIKSRSANRNIHPKIK